ncbi:hypothetical protein LCGC14_0972040 [marine sediment metagenome]|uniref:Uncharacterized protein n=1 Tax=marine sediment metagenome TaxID=412755 RepID=A0A0F9NFV3_9ZZZZ
MYNHVEDSGKGDPMFYELTDDEIRLHDEKNQDYRSTSNPVANFDRVAAWMALYPDMDWARPEMVAILYAQKQIDSAMSLMERGMEGGVETIDTRARDVHIYWKLFRVIRRKNVEVQSRAGPIRMAAGERLYTLAEAELPLPSWVPWNSVPPDKPRSLWQRFLARIGL